MFDSGLIILDISLIGIVSQTRSGRKTAVRNKESTWFYVFNSESLFNSNARTHSTILSFVFTTRTPRLTTTFTSVQTLMAHNFAFKYQPTKKFRTFELPTLPIKNE